MAAQPLAELAISLPFKIDALGKVAATLDQSKIWADKVRSVIGTALGQRIYRPQFGCNATLGVFDTEEYTMSSIEDDIREAFSSFLPLLEVQSVNVSFNFETSTAEAEVEYTTPNNIDYVVSLGIATIDGNGPLSEEFSWQIQ
jgi:phage baseplate assembly protein W